MGRWWQTRVPGLVIGITVGALFAVTSAMIWVFGLWYRPIQRNAWFGDITGLGAHEIWLACLIGGLKIIAAFAFVGLLQRPSLTQTTYAVFAGAAARLWRAVRFHNSCQD